MKRIHHPLDCRPVRTGHILHFYYCLLHRLFYHVIPKSELFIVLLNVVSKCVSCDAAHFTCAIYENTESLLGFTDNRQLYRMHKSQNDVKLHF